MIESEIFLKSVRDLLSRVKWIRTRIKKGDRSAAVLNQAQQAAREAKEIAAIAEKLKDLLCQVCEISAETTKMLSDRGDYGELRELLQDVEAESMFLELDRG